MADLEKHNRTKITLSAELADWRYLWAEMPCAVRLEVIKSLIYTAPSMHEFHAKVVKTLTSEDFTCTLD